MGRAGITTETAQNPANPTGPSITSTSTQTFSTTGELASDKSGPSGATTVYGYYPTSGAGSTGNGASPGALQSVKLVANGATLNETDYGYDPVSGRMNTITIVGQNGAPDQVFNITYKSGTDPPTWFNTAKVTSIKCHKVRRIEENDGCHLCSLRKS